MLFVFLHTPYLSQNVSDPSSKLLTRTTTLQRQGQQMQAVKDVAFVVYKKNDLSSGLHTIVIKCITAQSRVLSMEQYVM